MCTFLCIINYLCRCACCWTILMTSVQHRMKGLEETEDVRDHSLFLTFLFFGRKTKIKLLSLQIYVFIQNNVCVSNNCAYKTFYLGTPPDSLSENNIRKSGGAGVRWTRCLHQNDDEEVFFFSEIFSVSAHELSLFSGATGNVNVRKQ